MVRAKRLATTRRWSVRQLVRYQLWFLLTKVRGALLPILYGGITHRGRLRIDRGVSITARVVRAGQDVCLGPYVKLAGTGAIELGDGVVVNARCTLEASHSITIGERSLLGPDTYIVDSDHRKPTASAGLRSEDQIVEPVNIGPDVWIGRGATILKGVTIGRGAVIGAHAVVTRDVAPFTTVAGVPARPIGGESDRAT